MLPEASPGFEATATGMVHNGRGLQEVTMKLSTCALCLTLAVLTLGGTGSTPFDRDFEDATLRIDFHHTGDAQREFLALDRLYRQGVWAGSKTRLEDPFKYGGYRVEAYDVATGELLFSQGFDSYFGEYRTTSAAAKGLMATYHESVLLPFPKHPLRVKFSAHRRDGSVAPLFETTIDPESVDIASEPPERGVEVVEAHLSGPPATTLDIAILGEGYTADQIDLFRADLARASELLLTQEPYSSNRDRLAIRGVLAPSRESGCDEPTRSSYRDTTLGATFNSLGSERYVLTEDNRRLRNVAANVPYDALVIMINHDRYGGGGIYRLFCTFTAHSEWSGYLLLHEFGHSFGALGDEYYSSSTAYNDFYPRGHEPEEPNITALLDPDNLKWKDLVTSETELPTPWEKVDYDARDSAYQLKRSELNSAIAEASRAGASSEEIAKLKHKEEDHAAAHAQWAREYLAKSAFAGKVGAFEGAGYSSQGLYRPTLDCLMFSRGVQPLCVVCERAVERMIQRYTE